MINVTCAIILIEDKILVTQRSEKMKLPLKIENNIKVKLAWIR